MKGLAICLLIIFSLFFLSASVLADENENAQKIIQEIKNLAAENNWPIFYEYQPNYPVPILVVLVNETDTSKEKLLNLIKQVPDSSQRIVIRHQIIVQFNIFSGFESQYLGLKTKWRPFKF